MELLQIATAWVITKCDGLLLQIATPFLLQVRHGLLQIATSITKCDDYYKLRQYTGSLVHALQVLGAGPVSQKSR